jgi:RNA polymerase sigma factor (sigma-70 family)
VVLPQVKSADVVALDDALTGLAKLDEQQARVVELRFFGGLSSEEVAEVLKISASTVKRDWNVAKAWLAREMRKDTRGDTPAVAKD